MLALGNSLDPDQTVPKSLANKVEQTMQITVYFACSGPSAQIFRVKHGMLKTRPVYLQSDPSLHWQIL